jgi:hypothetical protein
MGKFARSARGAVVNFDELEIKHALKSVPPPVSVDQRRQFINDKDGVSAKKAAQIQGELASAAMALAQTAVVVEEDDTPLQDIPLTGEE